MKTENYKNAYVLYMQGDKTQKEIANIVGVTEKTIGKWINDFGWKEQNSKAITQTHEIIEVLRGFIIRIQKAISQENRTPTDSEAGIILKLVQSVETLDYSSESPFAKKVFREFKAYLKLQDNSLAELFQNHYNEYLQKKATQS